LATLQTAPSSAARPFDVQAGVASRPSAQGIPPASQTKTPQATAFQQTTAPDASTQTSGTQTSIADRDQDSGAQDAPAHGATSQGVGAAQIAGSSGAPAQSPTFDPLFAVAPQAPITASALSASAPADPSASDTVADLATQTAAQASTGASQFQITLTPEGLGQVSVTVNVGVEGKVSAAFAFEKPETAEALSGRASDLQKALEQVGFSLSDAGLSFSVATSSSHGQGAGADQNPGGGQQGAAGQGSSQGGANQGGSNHGGSGQGSNPAFAQTTGQGAGQGDGAGQGRAWSYGQAADRAFASANGAAAAIDQSPASAYASRAAGGLDIRI
jgi:hypothetical protein